MSSVSNFIGQISPSMFGTNPQGIDPNIDLNDTTFDDMLQKQIQNGFESNSGMINNFSVPSGIDIGIYDGGSIIDSKQSINNITNTQNELLNKKEDYTTPEVLTFFNSLFDTKSLLSDASHSGLYNFERKLAAHSYGKGASSVITDISEFVTDALKIS